jgi:glutathione S-transferase
MITARPEILWTASITLLIGLFYFFAAFRVGNLRAKHDIKAPLTHGHPVFDRAYRVQLNTLEQMAIVFPFLWVAAFYPIGWAWLAPLVGLIWLLSRIVYLQGYMSAPERRVPGAMLGGICTLALFAIAAVGVLQVWFAPPA